ncbi:hypothetical protein HBI88_091050 [Parastagonospora nodorum]|nr:hypothetical protein HBH96_125690 [Parastagonospora nodorum]KAH5228126.1 hypothetical protein HBI62_082140 [Parastagonospora nodorum]KAH5448804.1 hypothetical protein HBI30_165700 [Parastagonospora nodorum]KAH5778615.1 hypothetical protein HBI97_117750 [Parastagonospora nodorum]KAH5807021.1 hypothetical protein HBI96_102780 [Parastagonospora nodorum]
MSPVSATTSPVANSVPNPEPIAIVGLGCRFPGESDSPDEFWDFLLQKKSALSRPPLSRFNIDGFHSKKNSPGSLRPEGGYFISDTVFDFDPAFFGLTRSEATAMDPQQRKLLECVFEAFESGGIPLEQVSGSNTGCYVGNFTWDYGLMNDRDHDYPKPYTMTGAGVTILSNRVSYLFNLQGPSLTLDTACSSSLYAVHLATRALQSGEIDAAVVGGTNLILAVEVQMATDKMGVLSPTSTCHTFSSEADGYGRGEGIGALYLKRLSDAVRDRDPIRGVIRGTAANSNGKTSGITQPSAKGQEAVMREAYRFAGNLDYAETSYFECHGTGTAVGDPIETMGISRVFLPDETTRDSLLVGAVKTNIGHGEASSAMASIIKVIMSMENRTIPATIGITSYNPKIDFRGGKLQVVQDNIPWPENYPVRRASVNSFGYGGANAHAIIEAADSVLPGYRSFARKGTKAITLSPTLDTIGVNGSRVPAIEREEFVLPFSAHDFPTLKNSLANIRNVADQYDVFDLAFTLSERRSRFFNRAFAVVGRDSPVEDLDDDEIVFGKRGNGANIAFIFTGQGAQSPQMGKELMQQFPSYIATIRKLDGILANLGQDSPRWTIEGALMEPAATSLIHDVELSQPLCTAVQIALVDLLHSWGIVPRASVGHSSGEIASAYAAGILTAEEAIVFAYYRGWAVGKLNAQGTMLAVGASPEEVQPFLQPGVIIACYNSPGSVTLSGDTDAVLQVKSALEQAKMFVREVKTGGRAYHSHHMKQVGTAYEERAQAAIQNLPAPAGPDFIRKATFFSSVTGKVLDNFVKLDASYWRANLESPVRFTTAINSMLSADELAINYTIELGPHSALAGPLRQIRDSLGRSSKDLDYSATLVRGENSVTRLLTVAGALFVKGYPVHLGRVNAIEKQQSHGLSIEYGTTIVDLPRYSWNYTDTKNMRLENRPNNEVRHRTFPHHDLLGSILPGAMDSQRQWRNLLDIKNFHWLEEHKLGSQPVLPATGYLAIAVEAARQYFHGRAKLDGPFRYFFPHITIKAALNLPPAGTTVEILTSVRFKKVSDSVSSKQQLTFTIASCFESIWTEHCVGTVQREAVFSPDPIFDVTALAEPKTSHTWYNGFKKISLNYGPPFAGLTDILTDPALTQCVATTPMLAEGVDPLDSSYIVHPTTMDTCVQAILIAAHKGSLKELNRSFVPVSMEDVSIWSMHGESIPPLQTASGKVLAEGTVSSLRALHGSCQLSINGKPVFEAKKINSIVYAEDLNPETKLNRHPYLRCLWKPDIEKLSSNALQKFFVDEKPSTTSYVDALLDVLVHKYPSLDILIAGAKEPEFLYSILEADSTMRRFKSVTALTTSEDQLAFFEKALSTTAAVGQLLGETPTLDGKLFNLAVVEAKGDVPEILSRLRLILNADGRILLHGDTEPSKDWTVGLQSLDLEVFGSFTEGKTWVTLINPLKPLAAPPLDGLTLVSRTPDAKIAHSVKQELAKYGPVVETVSLADSSFNCSNKTIVVVAETDGTLFNQSMTDKELKNLQRIAEQASTVLWVTHGDLLVGADPNAAIVMGLGRCLQSEYPTLDFIFLDVDHRASRPLASQIHTVLQTIGTVSTIDREYLVKNDTFYVSRLSHDRAHDAAFSALLDTTTTKQQYTTDRKMRLKIERPGLLESLHFQAVPLEDSLSLDEAEVEVKAIGLNMKEVATFRGNFNSLSLSHEGSGIVRRVGANVTNVRVGDKVCWMAKGLFQNIETFKAKFLHKIADTDSHEEVATMPLAYSTAVYGLLHLGRLKKGESVLIHSGTGGVGLAAIQIAQMVGAKVFATVGTETKRNFLHEAYGLPHSQILNSRDTSFAEGVMKATNGRGVDVTLNSLVREQLHATWSCIATQGRHIEIGLNDILDYGDLDMSVFKRGASFAAFDFGVVADETPDVAVAVMKEVVGYFREGKIKPLSPSSVYPASEVTKAFMQFNNAKRIGKVVVKFEENDETDVLVAPKKPTYSPDVSYLLVGCLGGLGRCFAREMVQQGARHLIFLGRSGDEKPEASVMVRRMRSEGVDVQVIKGDVSKQEDVLRAVKAAKVPIAGVLQGVMALDDRLFSSYDINSWNYAIDPKVAGTWNLHNALADQPLDFFIMISSISAMTGAPTQGNYCAANTFLDFFARYRRQMGLPATTIALSMVLEVGFVSQSLTIEQGISRSGIHGIDEKDFIRLIEAGVAPQPDSKWLFDHSANCFLVSGLEPAKLASDIDVNDFRFWLQPRVGPLLNAILASDGNDAGAAKAKIALDLPGILEQVITKFAKTFSLEAEDIDTTKPLSSYGMDSMIGTDLRNWCYKQLGADIPTSDFMGPSLTAQSLAQKAFSLLSS